MALIMSVQKRSRANTGLPEQYLESPSCMTHTKRQLVCRGYKSVASDDQNHTKAKVISMLSLLHSMFAMTMKVLHWPSYFRMPCAMTALCLRLDSANSRFGSRPGKFVTELDVLNVW